MNIPVQYLPVVISASGFLVFALIIAGIVMAVRYNAKKKEVLQKIKHEAKEAVIFESAPLPSKSKKDTDVKNRFMEFLTALGKRTSVRKKGEGSPKLNPMFLKAGLRSENMPAVLLGAKVIFAVVLPVTAFLFHLISPSFSLDATRLVALLAILAIIGFYLPNLWLHFKIKNRKNTIRDGFPDALDLLTVCVEAGMGLDSAITRVAREIALTNKVLSDELNLYNLEMRAGKFRRDALKNLAMRTDLEEVNNLVTLLIQTDKFGTSVAKALKVYSDTMRTQRFQRAEEMAAKIPVKLLFPLILFIFPALFVAILGPAVINIYRILLKGSAF
jgi:tight adherence protein C